MSCKCNNDCTNISIPTAAIQPVTIQYSITGSTLWHTTYTAGDAYMRIRIGTGSWSAAIPFVGPTGSAGAAGADGNPGTPVVLSATPHTDNGAVTGALIPIVIGTIPADTLHAVGDILKINTLVVRDGVGTDARVQVDITTSVTPGTVTTGYVVNTGLTPSTKYYVYVEQEIKRTSHLTVNVITRTVITDGVSVPISDLTTFSFEYNTAVASLTLNGLTVTVSIESDEPNTITLEDVTAIYQKKV